MKSGFLWSTRIYAAAEGCRLVTMDCTTPFDAPLLDTQVESELRAAAPRLFEGASPRIRHMELLSFQTGTGSRHRILAVIAPRNFSPPLALQDRCLPIELVLLARAEQLAREGHTQFVLEAWRGTWLHLVACADGLPVHVVQEDWGGVSKRDDALDGRRDRFRSFLASDEYLRQYTSWEWIQEDFPATGLLDSIGAWTIGVRLDLLDPDEARVLPWRRTRFRATAAAALAFALPLLFALGDGVRLMKARSEVSHIEALHVESTQARQRLDSLEHAAARESDRLNALGGLAAARVPLHLIWKELAGSLPAEARLTSFDLKTSGADVRVSVHAVVGDWKQADDFEVHLEKLPWVRSVTVSNRRSAGRSVGLDAELLL